MAKLMSETLKAELARELGVAQEVKAQGWGSVSARDCGRLVQLAIAKAEETLSRSDGGR